MNRKLFAGVATLASLLFAGCGGTSDNGGGTPPNNPSAACQQTSNPADSYKATGIANLSGGATSLSGAGGTFVAPLMNLWVSDYAKATNPSVQVAYQAVGSGAGISQLQAQTVDFGESDAPMKDSEIAAAKGGAVLHIPLAFAPVVLAYKINGVQTGLKLSGETIGKIFAGKITSWNDPAITADNSGVTLPNEPIAIVHRSDASGTTSIFTNYLTKVSTDWVTTLGGKDQSAGKTVAWPVGIGGKGNDGVSGAINQTEGAVGYVELAYAIQQNLPFAKVKNSSGNFMEACVNTATNAASGFQFPADLRFDLTNAPGTSAYPIVGATWLLAYQNQTDDAKSKALVNFLVWIMDKGQKENLTLNYPPLSTDLRDLAIAQIKKIQLNGAPLVK